MSISDLMARSFSLLPFVADALWLLLVPGDRERLLSAPLRH